MIDNIVLVITGTHHDRDTQELLEKCHPLGMFDSMATLCVASTPSELYKMVLVDTPLGESMLSPAASGCAVLYSDKPHARRNDRALLRGCGQ